MPTDSNANRHAHAGKTIIEGIFEQADYKYADFMDLVEEETNWTAEEVAEKLDGVDDVEATAEEITKSAELRGLLRGMSFCLAYLRNPYEPNVDAIKEELHERFENAIDEDEEDDE